jgi:hypothetical protein
MLATTWYLLLAAAFATTFVSISRRIDERLGGAVSTVLWALAGVGSFEVEQTRTVESRLNATFDNTTGNVSISRDAGEIVTEASASPEVGFFAATMALLMLAFSLAAATGQLPSRDATRFDT